MRVVSYTDSGYFHNGELLLETRHRVNASMVVYGPDLGDEQIKQLSKKDIEYKLIDNDLFQEKMQFLKFKLIMDELEYDDSITFVDFDTFFMKDWSNLFNNKFDIGVTYVTNNINNRIVRAYANGGVIFANGDRSEDLCRYAIRVMTNGGDNNLPEYDLIYKTLEEGRPPHKTYKRDYLRWWVDQVFLSSLVYKFRKNLNLINDFDGYKVMTVNSDKYNCLMGPEQCRKAYIVHLKNKGRESIKDYRGIVK